MFHYVFDKNVLFDFKVQGLGDNKIRIGQVSPGLVETEIFRSARPDPKQPFPINEIFSFFPNIKADHVTNSILQKSP
jgi:hypothetical protein